MINGLYTSALGALSQTRKLEVIANNLANMDTPGFRRDEIGFAERLAEALEDKPDLQHYNALVDRYGGAPYIDEIAYDPNPGPLETTGGTFDFALEGAGYFAVKEAGSDEIFYTRNGNFAVDAQGRLLTADGRFQILSAEGEPIRLDLTGGAEVRLGEGGTLFVGQEAAAALSVVTFAPEAVLVKNGATVYRALAGTAEPLQNPRIKQGFLEGSSVNPVVEMVDMIKATRGAESNMLMIRFQDSTLERAITDLGRAPA